MLLSIHPGDGPEPHLVVQAHPKGPGEARAHIRTEVRPGQALMGWSYEELRALGNGIYEMEEKAPGAAGQARKLG
jgi:hypothetical protein